MSSPVRPADALIAELLGPLNTAVETLAAQRVEEMEARGELVKAETITAIEQERDDVINIVEGLGESIENLLTGMRSYVRRATFTYPGAEDWTLSADQLTALTTGLQLDPSATGLLAERVTALVRETMRQEAVRVPQAKA